MFGFSASGRVGALPAGFPALRAFDFDFSQLSSLIHPALTLAGLFTINQVLTGIVVCRAENRCGNSNRELIAQGAANIVTPFFGSPPGVAMLARTVASARAGATTRLSIYTHSLILLLLVIPFRGLIGQIPLSALAAVTVMVGFQLIDWKRLQSLRSMSRTDFALFLLTFSLVVFADLIVGVGVGFLVAMLLFIERSASSTHLEKVASEEDDEDSAPQNAPAHLTGPEAAGVQTYRLIGPLFFASSEKIYKQLEKEVTAKMLVLDLSAAGLVDSAATDFLRNVYRLQRAKGADLFLTGLGRQHLFIFERGGLLNELGAHRFNFTSRGAASYDENGAALVNTF
ncbi:MAG: SulP family inorganic anion transporter [Pyrinomonadaceae bacterium]